jgi:uncharacterized protein (DUF169 family)
MADIDHRETAVFIRDDLRLKTFPVAAKFLKAGDTFPEKARRPAEGMGKRIAICQGVTMARNYGWTVGLAREDVICTPAAIAFGFSDSENPPESLAELFTEVRFCDTAGSAAKETATMHHFRGGEIRGIVLAPMEKADFQPDVTLFYGNPAQMMRLAQAWSYATGDRVEGHSGGKVECDEYLIAPFKSGAPRMVIPGQGERIFAMTQDDEMAFALPGAGLAELVRGLKEAAKPIGARYPVTPYQNFEPDFPKAHKNLGKKLGVL